MDVRTQAIKLIASGVYTGYVPLAPGTAGTLVAIPLVLILSRLNPSVYALTLLAFIALACWVADRAGPIFGQADSPRIVIDEIAGFLTTMFMLSPGLTELALGFVFFRLADTAKPFPAFLFDRRVKNGLGVVLDDVVAGVYACLMTHFTLHFL